MCTRAMHTEKNPVTKTEKTITGRNFDWVDWSEAALWVYPKGLKRNGAAGGHSKEWTSDYKSVTVAGYNGATEDGINEKGLMANLLWLTGAVYPKPGAYPARKAVSISAWAQYILDTCTNVSDAIDQMLDIIYVVAANLPDDPGNPDAAPKPAECHLSVSDIGGNSAIFEYANGELMVYTNLTKRLPRGGERPHDISELLVMTNEPVFSEQLKLNALWKDTHRIDLPGTCSPVDRFIRATYYNNRLPLSNTPTAALAHVLSVMHNTAEPFEIDPSPEEHTSPTQYITLGDHENCSYYFGPAKSPFMLWIELNDIVFSPKDAQNNTALRMEFDAEGSALKNGKLVSGKMTTANFESAKVFTFLPAAE